LTRAPTIVAIVASLSAGVLLPIAACVGSDPGPTVVYADAGTPDGGGGPGEGEGGGGLDAGAGEPGDAGGDTGSSPADAAVRCIDGGEPVFPPGPASLGVFCGAATGPGGSNHCARGEHCCVPPTSGRTCAGSCGGGGGDFACNTAQDCAQDGGVDGGPLVCCAESGAVLDTTSCSYPIFTVLHHGLCQPSCGSQLQLCATESECGALHCVGATTPYLSYGTAICQ
jgi:hypothetical protein